MGFILALSRYLNMHCKVDLPTYHKDRSRGALTQAEAMWTYCQSLINQHTRANNAVHSGQDGTCTIQVRHLAKVNSACILYITVMKTPTANPKKNLSIVNISHPVEYAASIFKPTNAAWLRKTGGFRPIRSAICPASRFPASTPAICMEVIVCGIQALSHRRSHWKEFRLIYIQFAFCLQNFVTFLMF